ncbi:hypothetical protein MTO96_047233 [Rhipicephalus appendiculatus]
MAAKERLDTIRKHLQGAGNESGDDARSQDGGAAAKGVCPPVARTTTIPKRRTVVHHFARIDIAQQLLYRTTG